MPSNTFPNNTADRRTDVHKRSFSIRNELEKRAHSQNPNLSQRLGRRLERRSTRQSSHENSARRIMRWQDRTLLILGLVLLLLFIIRSETADANTLEWGIQFISDSGNHTELALETEVKLDITGLLARVEVTQQFTNQGGEWAEGVYRFPLPAGAAVDQMRIKVGERILEGEIQERISARRQYQKARDQGKTASLVEQQRENQFETRLANIGPGETIHITIGFLQNVDYGDHSYSLRLPMTFTPRWDPPATLAVDEKPVTQAAPQLVTPKAGSGHSLRLQANLVSSVELAAIESHYHDVDIRQVDNGYRLELVSNQAMTDRDFVLSWTPALQSQPSTSLMTFDDGEFVYAQLMLAPPLVASIVPQAREVILVIDTSGSMEGASIQQARLALVHALESLGPDDYFNVLEFNSDTRSLFDQSVPANQQGLYIAQNFITGLAAEGGTNMAPALKAALGMPKVPDRMRQVVFITDGAVGNEKNLLQMVADKLGDSRMFTVAIGHAPNSWFMRKAAEVGRGSYIHIGKPEEVRARMTALWSRIQLPALTNICVNWGDSAEFYPELIPDLYAGEPLWLTARLKSQPTIIGLCGEFNDTDWSINVNAWDAASGGDGGDNLAKLWARKKIEALDDSLMFGTDPELTQLQITGLALDYELLTRHTSLVAVDKTPRRPADEQLAQTQIPGLLPAGSSSQLAAFPSTATGWLTQLLLSALVLLLATFMLMFSGSRFPMTKPSTN